MRKVLYFDSIGGKTDKCSGHVYYAFLDYAFNQSNYFMLVFNNYYGKGLSKKTKEFKQKLNPYRIKSRSNPSWPGNLVSFSPNTTYKIIFYKNCEEAKNILKQVSKLSDWSCPLYPEDLAFFKGNQCWFYSVGHEKIGAFINATKEDILFAEIMGLSTKNDVLTIDSEDEEYFKKYDEIIEKNEKKKHDEN